MPSIAVQPLIAPMTTEMQRKIKNRHSSFTMPLDTFAASININKTEIGILRGEPTPFGYQYIISLSTYKDEEKQDISPATMQTQLNHKDNQEKFLQFFKLDKNHHSCMISVLLWDGLPQQTQMPTPANTQEQATANNREIEMAGASALQQNRSQRVHSRTV